MHTEFCKRFGILLLEFQNQVVKWTTVKINDLLWQFLSFPLGVFVPYSTRPHPLLLPPIKREGIMRKQRGTVNWARGERIKACLSAHFFRFRYLWKNTDPTTFLGTLLRLSSYENDNYLIFFLCFRYTKYNQIEFELIHIELIF